MIWGADPLREKKIASPFLRGKLWRDRYATMGEASWRAPTPYGCWWGLLV